MGVYRPTWAQGRARAVRYCRRFHLRHLVPILFFCLFTARSSPVNDPITANSAHTEAVTEWYESMWGVGMGALILLLLGVIVFTGVHWASMPPSRVEIIDATKIHLSGEFVQENLGTALDTRGNVTVRVLAEQYAFRPHCLVVPDGQRVTFRATSSDVVHGLQILGTNVNSMLVPGYISTFIATVHGEGDHLMPCHEYCSVGHATMWATVRVLPKDEFAALAKTRARLSCD